jgi:hypothetical protein
VLVGPKKNVPEKKEMFSFCIIPGAIWKQCIIMVKAGVGNGVHLRTKFL